MKISTAVSSSREISRHGVQPPPSLSSCTWSKTELRIRLGFGNQRHVTTIFLKRYYGEFEKRKCLKQIFSTNRYIYIILPNHEGWLIGLKNYRCIWKWKLFLEIYKNSFSFILLRYCYTNPRHINARINTLEIRTLFFIHEKKIISSHCTKIEHDNFSTI